MSSLDPPICVAPAGDRCGEAPVWHAGEGALYWVDINRFLLHRYDEATASVKSWFFEEPVTALALTNRDDHLLVALGSRLVLWNTRTNERMEHGFTLPGWPAVRLNDGRADPRGSFWVGSMRNNVHADGSAGEAGGSDGVLYRIDGDGSMVELLRGICISNTLCWSPDRTRFYFADTPTNTVCVYDYDALNGTLGEPRVFFAGFERGLPDGSVTDADGYLWNARYGGGCVVRVAPDGRIDRIVDVPAHNVTSCAFGGADLHTLYITTAGADAPPGDRLGGSLFALRTGVAGLSENRFLAF
jgi:sugar lactone lactonase YvrE